MRFSVLCFAQSVRTLHPKTSNNLKPELYGSFIAGILLGLPQAGK